MCKDSRIVPGAAATEIELARRVKEFSFKETGYFLYFLFFITPSNGIQTFDFFGVVMLNDSWS